MRTRCLSQFSMAVNGIRLTFWGEADDSVTREIYIEQPFVGIARDEQISVTYDWDNPAVATTLLATLGARIASIAVAGGRPIMTFANGVNLTVDPDDHYESSQINSDDGLLRHVPGAPRVPTSPAGLAG